MFPRPLKRSILPYFVCCSFVIMCSGRQDVFSQTAAGLINNLCDCFLTPSPPKIPDTPSQTESPFLRNHEHVILVVWQLSNEQTRDDTVFTNHLRSYFTRSKHDYSHLTWNQTIFEGGEEKKKNIPKVLFLVSWVPNDSFLSLLLFT